MRVTICGPNLRYQSKGQFHVHAADCADLGNYGPGRKQGGDDKGWTVEATSRFDVADDVYCDNASDYGYEPFTDEYEDFIKSCLSDFHFAPCCADLPVFKEAVVA